MVIQDAQQIRVLKVLENIKQLVEEEEYYADAFSEYLDTMLDDMNGQDIFGTEGQQDPRGDMRNDSWSMNYVEGVD